MRAVIKDMSSSQGNLRIFDTQLPQDERELSWVMNVDAADSPRDVIDALALQRFIRCMAQLEIGRLPGDEASAWLERSGTDLPPGARIAPKGSTLAELTALAASSQQITTAPPAPEAFSSGNYL